MTEQSGQNKIDMVPKIVLALTGAMFAAYGFACLVMPSIVGMVTSLSAEGVAAKVETQAMYGGLQLGLGIWALTCAVRAEWQRAGLMALLFLIGGMTVGRAYGLFLEPNAGAYIWAAMVFEGALTLAICVALVALAGKKDQNALHHKPAIPSSEPVASHTTQM